MCDFDPNSLPSPPNHSPDDADPSDDSAPSDHPLLGLHLWFLVTFASVERKKVDFDGVTEGSPVEDGHVRFDRRINVKQNAHSFSPYTCPNSDKVIHRNIGLSCLEAVLTAFGKEEFSKYIWSCFWNEEYRDFDSDTDQIRSFTVSLRVIGGIYYYKQQNCEWCAIDMPEFPSPSAYDAYPDPPPAYDAYPVPPPAYVAVQSDSTVHNASQ